MSTPAPRATASLQGVNAARVCAFTVVRRVFEHGAYADRSFAGQSADLGPRDRALAMQLAYGTVQRKATLDYIAGHLASRPPAELDPPVLAALRLGLYQLLFLGGVAQHAAVNESVELAKLSGGRGAGLVNAVLRRAAREGAGILEGLDDRTPAAAALHHSVPEWLAEQWWEELGSDTARALLARVNEPAESALRVNTLVADRDEICRHLPVPAQPAPGLPEGVVLGGPFDAYSSEYWQQGAIMPQSRGSMLVSKVLGPSPGERVLDLCAAPGAKTTHLAALMGDDGTLVAVERHRGRARSLIRTCARMRATCVKAQVGDAGEQRWKGSFDSVLVDPPCSGLGTLQSRPDLRWRTSPEKILELVQLQARILDAGAAATAPGGALVYSVCTISRAESEDVVERFLSSRSDFTAEDLQLRGAAAMGVGAASSPPGTGRRASPYLQLLPHREGTDGFFIALMRRA